MYLYYSADLFLKESGTVKIIPKTPRGPLVEEEELMEPV